MSSLTTEIIDLDAAFRRTSRARIRPAVAADVERVRDLWIKSGATTVPAAGTLSRRLSLQPPWRDNATIVYEDNGRVAGCLAMTSRPMVFRDRSIRAVIGHSFVTDSSRAGARAGIELVRHLLNGSQDLSLAVWNDFGRRIWTSLGGSVTPFHSLSWTRALLPAQYVLRALRRRVPAAVALYPAFEAVDATLNVFRKRAHAAPAALADDLDAVTMLSYLSAFANDRALRPCYDVASLRWLLETLTGDAERGRLQKVAVRTHSGRPLGWYVYYLRPAGAAEVLQIGGKDDALPDVVDHLFDHARQRGAVAITGPMDARLVGALSERQCAFHRPRSTWALFHTRDPRIAEAIHAGDVFWSRLEGVPWLESEA